MENKEYLSIYIKKEEGCVIIKENDFNALKTALNKHYKVMVYESLF